MLPDERDALAEAPTPEQSIAYLRDMLSELSRMALRLDHRDLAYFIDVARLEAALQARELTSARERSG